MVSRSRRRIILGFVILFATTALVLARWQWQRHVARRQSNVTMLGARTLSPIDLDTATPSQTLDGRRVTVRGQFDPARQILLRGRVHRSAPGLHVVTAFRATQSRLPIWVLRGFVNSPDAATPPATIPEPPQGEMILNGMAFAIPATGDSGQPLRAGALTFRRLDRTVLAEELDGSPDFYVMQSDGGTLPLVEPPSLDTGPHLSYAIQWVGIALAIAAFGVIVVRPAGRARLRPDGIP